jgi:hypothetical protein
MIVNPVLIIGAPRSGTSLLQKILRNHPAFWSLPSESDMIWDRFCHPGLRNWDSEYMADTDIMPADRAVLIRNFEKYMRPAAFWKPFERTNLIWGFRRMPLARKLLRSAYQHIFPLMTVFSGKGKKKRLIEKTASNCFRLGYVNEVFPDAKIIYPTRDGRNNINSLINAWRHPTRFFTYDVPEELHIKGCPVNRWKFVLPPGWRDYTKRSLAEVCAFQWRSCHEAMLAETALDKYRDRVLRIKLESIVANPEKELAGIADFIGIPFEGYLRSVAENLPIVNSPDNNVSEHKWLGRNREMIESVLPSITHVMHRLGYEA